MARRKGRSEQYQVFVSHASADKWLATVLCGKIDAIGVRTFRDDRDIDGGDDIPEKIRDAIERSDEMVILFTPVSVDRPWVLLEAGAAWQSGLRVISVLQYIQVDTIPGTLKAKKVIDLNKFDDYIRELGQRVKATK